MKHTPVTPIVLAMLFGLLMLMAVTESIHMPQPVSASQAEQQSSGGTICFATSNSISCVQRLGVQSIGTITDQVRSLIQSMLSGPTFYERAAGVQSALPDRSALGDLAVTPDRVVIDLDLPADFIAALSDAQVEAANEQIMTTLTPYDFKRVEINARAVDGTYKLLSSFLKPIVIPQKQQPPSQPSPASAGEGVKAGQPPIDGQPQARGGLYGKTVFVSAGHGWYYNTSLANYLTQRPTYPSSPYPAGEGIVEDFNNAEVVNQYLLQYLWNAGADAWTVRERDMNTSMLIADDSQAAFSVQGVWLTGTTGYSNSYHAASTVNSSATATATWTFTPLITSTFAVYVWFAYPVGVTRTVDAHYYIDHAGATTPVTVTQTRDGNNWRFLGMYPFYGGQPAHIRLTNQSVISGLRVIADAIRIGGGLGDVSVAGAPPSGKPRWEEQSMQYAKWVGLPDVDTLNDVIVRPIYAEWEKAPGEDSVYVAWHTNGYNGYNTTASGTESYVYLSPTPGSNLLQDSIHAALLNGIHAQWDPNWIDRGEKSADFGEVRLLSSMPGVLIENGYHDNPIDVKAQKDPRFNLISARAVYHGLVAYWHSLQPLNVPLIFLPESPTHLIVRNGGAGQVVATWQPGPTDSTGTLGDAATAYRVYTSTDGFGWNDGIGTTQSIFTLTNLLPNQLIYVRVTGVNAGGESFPTPVMAARVSASSLAPVLLVYGNDRIDYSQLIQQSDGPDGLNRRMFLNRINTYNYIIQHADAITLPFDSAQHASVTDGSIGLGNYSIVDWIAGEDQSPDTALKASDQIALTNFMNGGGSLFMSGSEVGYDLTNIGGTAFYNNTLHATYVADNGDVNHAYVITPLAGSILSGLGSISFDDSTHGTYNVNYPDAFNPRAGASQTLVYNGGASAGIQYDSGTCSHLVYFGVPFESIYPAAVRHAVMSRVMGYLSQCVPASIDTTIVSPIDGLITNTLPAFNGGASSTAIAVQVSIKNISDSTFYNGTIFAHTAEVWLNANGANSWNYGLPSLLDGSYLLRARSIASGTISDTTPAAVTFTLDTVAPLTPTLITPTGSISIVAVTPTFVWSSGGNPDRFEIAVDGITTSLNSPVTSTHLYVPDGVHQWRVRAFDAASNTSGWSDLAQFQSTSIKSYLPVILQQYQAGSPPSAVTCTNVITNGDFETGNWSPQWSSWSQNPLPGVVTSNVNAGNYSARVGVAPGSSATGTGFSSIQQLVTIPANALTATLSFARYSYSTDTIHDLQYVAVLNPSNAVLEYLVFEYSNQQVWTSFTADLLPYVGQSINLRFSAKNTNLGSTTGMLIDNVVLNVCTP